MPVRTRLVSRVAVCVATAAALVVGGLTALPASAGTYAEQQGHRGANTFTNYHNASGMGAKVPAAAWVDVTCKVYDPFITSVSPDGYWYRIASAPWNNQYYAAANTFMNGDPWSGPYTHNTDMAVPDCSVVDQPPPQQPPPSQQPPPQQRTPAVHLDRGPVAPAGYRYAVSLSGFASGQTVSVSCRDSVSPGGFYTFSLQANGSGAASTHSYCYSADGPDHWVVAGGVESNHVSWTVAPSGGTPAPHPPSTPQVPVAPPAGGSQQQPPSAPVAAHYSDPCLVMFPAGASSSAHPVFGGKQTDYDRYASDFQMCEGWGLPTEIKASLGLRCAVIAAAFTLAGSPITKPAENACDAIDAGSLLMDLHQWKSAALGYMCDTVGEALATTGGLAAAGGTAITGPGAVAVGAGTFRVLKAFFKVSCAALSNGDAQRLGQWLEGKHEAQVRADVMAGRCLRVRTVFGAMFWSATTCS